MFTRCFGNYQKCFEVMKLIVYMPWSEFLKRFNQGNKLYLQYVKKATTKTDVKNEEVVLTLKDDTTKQEQLAE